MFESSPLERVTCGIKLSKPQNLKVFVTYKVLAPLRLLRVSHVCFVLVGVWNSIVPYPRMPRQGASYSSASSSGGKKQKNSSYQKKKRMTGVSAPVGDEDIDQDDLEDALMVNREYQEQLRLTYFHLEDVKVSYFTS